ncbi:MAG: RHS repeat-associated core domain-containing protein [Nannocystaceae bacterium]|nr:RHS repeat-associated core domain-containing protein [Nannocystaceae bacterium]
MTERLLRLQSHGGGNSLQDLHYSYDPVGNLTQVRDAAQAIVYRDNAALEAVNDYRYDALYRLVEASGREHEGQAANGRTPRTGDAVVLPLRATSPNDPKAMRRYVQRYRYDAVGNLRTLQHHAGAGSFRREYAYAEHGNRLRATGNAAQALHERYAYDVAGHMVAMPHLQKLVWDENDALELVHRGTQQVWLQYAGGVRVRKLVRSGDGVVEDRVYLGAEELYTKRRAGVVVERTLTEHVGGALQVDIKLVADGNTIAKPVALRRYALADHLGSVKLEVDPDGKVIAYEEFHPYGTSSYRAMRSGLDAVASRYRYTGMERDEETGLAQHGARYYAAWLGRWTSADPTGLGDGVNRYAYCRGSPLTFSDTNGCDAVSATDPAVLTAMLQAESTRQAAVQHAWRSQMQHALDGVDEVDVAIAAASASEALHGPDLPEASWSGAVENFLADAAVTSAQIALVPLMWKPDAPAVRWAGELEAYKNPYVVREEHRAIQAASEWVLIAATIVFEPGNAAGVASIARGGLAQLRRLRGAVLRPLGAKADDAIRPAVRLAHRVDLSAGGELIDDGVRSVDQPLANTAAEGGGLKALPPARTFTSFRDQAAFDQHFAKHAAEWGEGNITQAGYLRRAQSFGMCQRE